MHEGALVIGLVATDKLSELDELIQIKCYARTLEQADVHTQSNLNSTEIHFRTSVIYNMIRRM